MDWERLARGQCGLLTRAQLRSCGVDRWMVRNRLTSGRWVLRSPNVVGTTTGPLDSETLKWLGVLHAGDGAVLGGLTVAEDAGLKNWHREDVTVLVPYGHRVAALPGIDYVCTRKVMADLRSRTARPPSAKLEPAVLLWASAQSNRRTAQGVLAAVVQQRLATPEALTTWVDRLSPITHAPLFRRVLADFAGGVQSVAELDVRRMCRRFGLQEPRRQVKRRDSSGRLRYTDCEWLLPDGRTLILEVDGAFHMAAEHWEDDLARQRALTSPSRLVVRCTAREVRDTPEEVARDLTAFGIGSRTGVRVLSSGDFE